MRVLWRWVVLLGVITPALAWWWVKPVRVLAPGWVGLSCPTAYVCVEAPEHLEAAQALHAEALAFVREHVGALQHVPKVVFCSTQRCADRFGLGERAGVTVGTWGTVMAPRGWHDYLVRHEMIHHLQAERVGTLQLLRKPRWWVEGMAYALSEDPRDNLREPFQADRDVFRAWAQAQEQAQVPQGLWRVPAH